MALQIRVTRAWQVAILVLLIASAVQVVWWIVDQTQRTDDLRERLTQLYTEDARAASTLQALGADEATIEDLFPHLVVDPQGRVAVRPDALETLRQERIRWLNQYGWEGTFFLVVLFVSMAAVWRALHEERILRRRQENFIAAVSHELKSPLASLQLSVETMSLRDPSRDQALELLGRMASDCTRMEEMLTKILEASQLGQRHVALHPEEIVLATAASNVVGDLENKTARAGVEIHLEIDPDLRIYADPVGVRTVLHNLFDNALKAVAAKEDGSIRVRATRDSRFVHVSVEDNGVGFPREEAGRLFEKFYRPGDEMSRKGSGQGLGLYIVKRFVELERGRLKAHSDGVGSGAVFEVSWPVNKEEKS